MQCSEVGRNRWRISGSEQEISSKTFNFYIFFCIDTHVEDDWGQTGQHLAVDLGNAELVAAFSNKEDDDDDEKDDEDMVCCMYNFVFTDKLQSFGQEINKKMKMMVIEVQVGRLK